MTKYHITSALNLYKIVRTVADFSPDREFMNKVREGSIEKIFNNPITCIAYDLGDTPDIDYVMDKKDVIRALDFWISDKILENEKLLKLNNKLDDFQETELKKLINLKTSVLKMDSDTKFKRFEKGHYSDTYNMIYTDTVEFWYEKKKAPEIRQRIPIISTTGTMPNRTITGTTTWNWSINDIAGRYLGRLGNNDEMPMRLGGGLAGRRITRVTVWGRRLELTGRGDPDPNTWVTRREVRIDGLERYCIIDADQNLIYGVGVTLDQARDIIEAAKTQWRGEPRVTAPQQNNDPNTWTVYRMGDNRSRWMVRDPNGRMIADNFLSENQAQGFIELHKTNYIDSPNRPNTGRTPQRRIHHGVELTVTQGEQNPHNWWIVQDGERFKFRASDSLIWVRVNDHELSFPNQAAAEESRRQHRQIYDREGWGNNTTTAQAPRSSHAFDHIQYTQPSNPHEWTISSNPNGAGWILLDRNNEIVSIRGTNLIYGSRDDIDYGLRGHRELWDHRHPPEQQLDITTSDVRLHFEDSHPSTTITNADISSSAAIAYIIDWVMD